MSKSPRTVCLLAAFSLNCAVGLAESPKAPGAYWSNEPDDIRTVTGTQIHNGVVVRNTEYTERTVGVDDCDGEPCTRYERTIRFLPPETESTFSITILMVNRPEETCSWGIEVPNSGRIPMGCTHKDLVGPIEVGTEWTFPDRFIPLLHQLDPYPGVEFRNVVEQTGVSRTIDGKTYKNCIIVRRSASVTPDEMIDCRDGSSSKVQTSISIENWYCPGVGGVFEQATELHAKIGSSPEVCYQVVSKTQAQSFHNARMRGEH